jgi:hypothetical protein
VIKFPFSRKLKGESAEKLSDFFADYCREELERRRDCGGELDEARFHAAVDLAVGRLRGIEDEGKA